MPNWKKVITSGSDASLNTLSVDNNTHLSGSLNVFKSGSTVFTIEGSQGTLFQITDQLSGSLFAVSDISGVPSFEVFSDDTVKIGTFGSEAVVVEGDVLKLSQLSNQSSEATAVVINGSDVVGTRELGSNAFTSTTIPTNNNQLTNGAGYITDGNTNWDNSYGFITGLDWEELGGAQSTINISGFNNDAGYITDGNTNWNNSYGFITATSTDTLTNKSGNISMFTNDAGYITDGNTNWNNSYGFITATSTDTLTNKSGNISMFTNDAGYITDGNTNWNNSYGFITGLNWTELGGDQADINISGFNNDAGYITSYLRDMGDGFKIANSAGTDQFTVTENEEIRFAGSGATSVSFNASTQTITISSTDNNTTYSVGDGGLTQINFTTARRDKLDGIAAGAEVNVQSDWNASSGDALILNKPTIPTNNNQLTNGAGYITDGNTGWNNSYGFITGLNWSELGGTQSDINLSGFNNDLTLSSFTNDTGYVSGDTFDNAGTYANLRAQATTAGDVGLGNVTNESKATMFSSPAFTGNPTAPTQTSTNDSTRIATTAFVQNRIDEIIGNAGSTLDTLGELSASLSDDQDALTSLTTTVGTKLAKSSNLSDLTNASTARTNLGLGTAATTNSTAYATAAQGALADSALQSLGSVTGHTDVTSAGSGAIITSEERTKLSGIATGAEVNVQSDWNASSGDALILNKPTIPTNNNQLTNGAGYITGLNWSELGGSQSDINISEFNNDSGFTTNTGTVTSVATGTGLTGGTISSTGTISLATAGAGAGTYGSAANGTKIDTITIDAYGRVTAVATGATGTSSTSGTVTSVATGDGLTGGTITSTGTISLVYEGAGENFIDVATNLEGTSISTGDTIIYHDANDNNIKKGLVSDLPLDNYTKWQLSDGTTQTNVTTGTTVTFSAGSNIAIANSSNTITISATDTNTTYSAGSLLDLSGTTFNVDLSELTDMTTAWVNSTDEFVVLDNGVQKRKLGSEIFGSNAFNSTTIPTSLGDLSPGDLQDEFTLSNTNVSEFNNDAGYTTNTGTVTSVGITTSAGLDGSGTITSAGTVDISLDLSELTDMTGAINTAEDEIILLDNGAQRRKRFSEIFGSNAYNSTTIPTNNNQLTNGAGYTTNLGDITGVTAGTGLTGGGSSGTVTLNVSGLTTSELAGSSLQTSGEVFSDSDTILMTAAAIDDRIDSKTYGSWEFSADGSNYTVNAGANVTLNAGENVSITHDGSGNVDIGATDTDTTYSAGTGLNLNPATTFNVDTNLSTDGVHTIGRDGNDKFVVNATNHAWYLDGVLDMRLANTGQLDVDGNIVAYSTVTNSDRRLKTDISTIESASEKVSKLRGVEYTWDYGKLKGKRDIGLIAQEVEEVIPEVVTDGELLDGTEAKRVDYGKLVGLLIEANKEQQTQIQSLIKEVEELKGRL